ncbi:c-type cytochrome [Marinobacter sp.]|uniref:c-type cytochrome n=1 Tax=Marinobacter sp. TaxID=50741 RepID=UPI002B4625D9|nr:c-type cytochrome [Marinobacter sp.]HKK55672.1 c-type cytochrome [Marinobacter sp.]
MKRFSAVFVRMQSRKTSCQADDSRQQGCPVHRGWRLAAGLLLLTAFGSTLAQSEGAPGGQQVYMDNCSVCHGESGDGKSGARFGLKPPPASFVDNYSGTREQMLAVATHGIPGTAMVGWGTRLSDLELAAAVDYIIEAFVESSAVSQDPHAGLAAMPSSPLVEAPGQARSQATEAARPSGTDHPGAESYASNCSVCHGETGEGAVWGREGLNPPPVDFTDETATQGLTRARMIASVIHGRPGTAMVGFGKRIPQDEIEAMVDYIRSEFMGLDSPASAAPASAAPVVATATPELQQAPAVTQPEVAKGVTPRDYMGYESVPMDTPMPSGVNGDAARGAVLFAASCVSCHGAEGKGDGPRAYFIFPKPRNFTSPESRRALNRPAISMAVQHGVRGREMPAWRHVLSDQEIADVSEYVFSAFIEPR